MSPLSGSQTTLSAHGYTADIASVGATLRTLRYGGRDLIAPFDADEVRPDYFGAILVPWPNRIEDGKYRFDGEDYEVALTEPKRFHALHGLASWLDFTVVDSAEDRVSLEAAVVAQLGYPFPLTVRVEYLLAEDGLTTRVTTRNDGARRAPYGVAPHPYLMAGSGGPVDGWTLRIPAERVMEVDERLSPLEVADVHDDFDFREARPLGPAMIDNAFTGLIPDADGAFRVTVADRDGVGAEMVWGEGLPWVQVFTGDLPTPEWNRRAIAVEPMTCPPDAFNSGDDLIVLEPGASHTAQWRLAAIG